MKGGIWLLALVLAAGTSAHNAAPDITNSDNASAADLCMRQDRAAVLWRLGYTDAFDMQITINLHVGVRDRTRVQRFQLVGG